jgi:choline dehydrogenase-like flavoprotein
VTFFDENNQFSKETSRSLGDSGPLKIAPAELVAELAPFREALKSAWISTGNKIQEDIYSGTVGGLVTTTNTIYHGTRSNSVLFVRGKPNITILPSTITRKVIIEDNIATSVLVESTVTGSMKIFRAKKEVIIAQGVFESPKLLMLSGVGPKEALFAHEIDLIVDSPHVGQNLIDHPIMPHAQTKTGPKASGLLELAGFPRIDSRLEKLAEWQEEKARTGSDVFGPQGQPHFEIDFVPMFGSAFQWHFPTPAKGDYFTVIVDLLRPLSRGQVQLNSANPREAPNINLGFFKNELDLLAMREGVRWVDEVLMKGEGMRDIIDEDFPWPLNRESDEELRHAILERASTGFRKFRTLIYPCFFSQYLLMGVSQTLVVLLALGKQSRKGLSIRNCEYTA